LLSKRTHVIPLAISAWLVTCGADTTSTMTGRQVIKGRLSDLFVTSAIFAVIDNKPLTVSEVATVSVGGSTASRQLRSR
jgi:hypothetical protein